MMQIILFFPAAAYNLSNKRVTATSCAVGEFLGGNLEPLSTTGRLGNIQGRPNEADLQEISEKVVGILRI